MALARKRNRRTGWQQWLTDLWTRTPGWLKWVGGILLGALVRLVFAAFFPEHWERATHTILDPTMPIWLAVVALVAILLLERVVPRLYRQARARPEESRLQTLFGVRWAVPPDSDQVRGPYCLEHEVKLRGLLWSGDSSPTLWMCPTCGREYNTPEFQNITEEVERTLAKSS